METLIVSVFVGVTLIVLFVQLQNISNSYQRSFTYNTTNALYSTKKIKEYIYTRNLESMINDVTSTTKGYIDIGSCNAPYYTLSGESSAGTRQYCTLLYEKLNVKKIFFTIEDLTNVQYTIEKNAIGEGTSQKMVDFIHYIKYQGSKNVYRLIVEFKDNTFASIKITR